MNERGPHSLMPNGTEREEGKSTGQAGAPLSGGTERADGSARLSHHDLATRNLTFEPGAKVGRYRLLAPIASGGMAQVWAARPEGFGFARTVALKLIRHEYAADEEYVRMFIDEATVAAAIQHPNVCETYELKREEGVLYMALEWVAGDSLAGILHQADGMEPLSYRMAARIVADSCAGLHAAHEATDADGHPLNVVHRDVSPPNILLSLHGQVKVSDFGIAKARYQLHSKTKTGEIKGKFSYIAPEQIGAKQVDRRADVFALGCVLYVATLGLRPFGSGPRAMGKILTGEYKRPASLVENYPPELGAVIERCLQRYPDQRYATAEEMRDDLERWLLNSGDTIASKDIAQLVQARIDPEKRRITESLLRSNQVLADAVAIQLMRNEETQTPTATSSVMFGPAAGETRAPSPVTGRRRATKPSVRFSPFASVPPGPSQELQQVESRHTIETVRPAQRRTSPESPPDDATLRDEPQSRQSDNSRISSQWLKSPHLKVPYTWLAIGILLAAGLILALAWSSQGAPGSDHQQTSGESR